MHFDLFKIKVNINVLKGVLHYEKLSLLGGGYGNMRIMSRI